MAPSEQVIFQDRGIYITNTRLVLRKGGTYPIASLAQVVLGREASKRIWISFLIFALIFFALGAALNENDNALAKYTMLLLEIGGVLLLLGLASILLQMLCPLYVVVLKGSFGTTKPIKSRNRRYILHVVGALNEALSKRGAPSTSITHIGQLIHDHSQHIHDIVVGPGGQTNIGTSGHASNQQGGYLAARPTSGPFALSGGAPNSFLGAQPDLHAGSVESNGGARGSEQARLWSVTQPFQASAGACRLIISYSHEDQPWLSLLRKHLAPLEQQRYIALWDDSHVTVGMPTREAINEALKLADFALLLVSPHFLASDVIMRYELPQIFQRQAQGRFTLLPLLLSPCLYTESALGRYQPFNPDNPLSTLAASERDEILVRIAREIARVV